MRTRRRSGRAALALGALACLLSVGPPAAAAQSPAGPSGAGLAAADPWSNPPSGQDPLAPPLAGQQAAPGGRLQDQLDTLGSRLKALTPDQNEALRAVLWQDIKDKTMSEVYGQIQDWRRRPGDYVAYMDSAIDRALALGPEDARALAAQVPEDFGRSGHRGDHSD